MSRYVSLTVNLDGALDAMQAVQAIPARILQAQKRALGTLQRRLGTEAKRDIGAEYNLRAARIAQGLDVRNTSDGIKLVGKARGINAIEFGATWSRVKGSGVVATSSRKKFTAVRFGGGLRGDSALGAKYAIKRGAPRTVHADSFIARGRNGALLVFERRPGDYYHPGSGWKANSKSNRIERIQGAYGPSIGQMLKHGRRPERLVDFAIRTLQSEQARLLGGSTP
jgi:hypothetical protein